MDALRFGADNVFRSKDTSITDADIDAIMEHGKVMVLCTVYVMCVSWKGRSMLVLPCLLSAIVFSGKSYRHVIGRIFVRKLGPVLTSK